MKIFYSKYILILLIIAVFFTLISCTGGKHLRTVPVEDSEDTAGRFTLILYGTADYDGLNAISFLDVEGDNYAFVPYAPKFEYTVIKNVSYKDALLKSLHHINHHSFRQSEIKRVINDTGMTIGYEVRPLYMPFVYGFSDILEVDYWLMDGGTVKITIDISRQIKERFHRSVDDF